MSIEIVLIPQSAIHEPNAHQLYNTLKGIKNLRI
jgi:hypothetical protein